MTSGKYRLTLIQTLLLIALVGVLLLIFVPMAAGGPG